MFCRIEVNSWHDVVSLYSQISRRVLIWAFRGQMDEKWPLTTRFEREANKYKCNPYFFKNREQAILKEFQRKAHQYIRNSPPSSETIDWLSFIQHYGGPTRLLDFTYSYYIAIYFATESSYCDCSSSIWALNISKLLHYLEVKLDVNRLEYERVLLRCSQCAKANIEEGCWDDGVLLVEPFHQHERIGIQQGTFLFPTNIGHSFEHNVSKACDFDYNQLTDTNADQITLSDIEGMDCDNIDLLKIILPYHIHPEIIQHLQQMNINSASLFPGLDGFARSLTHYFRDLEYRMNT